MPQKLNILIDKLQVKALIGAYPLERHKKQRLVLSLKITPLPHLQGQHDDLSNTLDYADICHKITDWFRETSFYLLETAAHYIVEKLFETFPIYQVKITIEKPSIIPIAKKVGISFSKRIHLPSSDSPVSLEINTPLRGLESRLSSCMESLCERLGFKLPFPRVVYKTHAPKEHYTLFMNGIPMIKGKFFSQHVKVKEEVSLRHSSIPFTVDEDCLWVLEDSIPHLDQLGIPYATPLDLIEIQLTNFYLRYAHEFLGVQEVYRELQYRYSDLIKMLDLPIIQIVDILKRLLKESIPIKEMKSILETLIYWSPKEKSALILTEMVRLGLKRTISHHFLHNTPTILSLDPSIENTFRTSIVKMEQDSHLCMDPPYAGKILDALRRALSSEKKSTALITSPEIRPHVRKLIENQFPKLGVLSYQEISPEFTIKPIAIQI